MRQKIYCMGAYRDDTSLGIYSDALMKELEEKYNIIDIRRKYQELSFVQHVFQYIKFIFIFMIYQKFNKNDIILEIHNINMIPPLMLGKRWKKVHIVHDFFYYDKDFYINKKWIAKWMYYYYNTIHKWLYRFVFEKSDSIIAISQATKNEIINKFWSSFADKIEVIHNGMDTSAFKPLSQKEQKSDHNQYLLYVGSELWRKNLKNIIAAFALVHKEFPNLKLIKAPCEWVANYRNHTLQAIKDNNLKVGKDVVFVDEYLPLEKLVELYQNAEIFLFPTLKEGFWFPIIEAQACWVPVITSNYEPMSELVPYKEMLVDPNNPKDIAEKIISILKKPDLKKQMIKDGLEYVKQFSWEQTAKKFEEVFKKL